MPNFSLHKLRLWNEYFFQWFKKEDNLTLKDSINENEITGNLSKKNLIKNFFRNF
jgi:hypothetical protein